MSKPKYKQCANWPHVSFFGLYDGHGGSACANFLKDELHNFVQLILIIDCGRH